MVNFIRNHKNWCRTCTPFEKELRRYFHWEESEKVSTDVEHILHLRRSWEGISIWECWIFSNILIWEGIEKVFLLRRTWEAWNYYREVEMDLRRWDGSEKEMYPPEKSTQTHDYLFVFVVPYVPENYSSSIIWAVQHMFTEILFL